MAEDYTQEAYIVAEAIDSKYENKIANKVNNISGDFSSDNVSYPTVKAVKNAYGEKKTSWASTPSDSDVPSEKLVKDTLDTKLDIKLSTANRFVITDSSKNVTLQEKLGNITLDGKIGTASGKIITTGTGGVLQASDNLLATDILDSTAHTHIGSSANDSQASINTKLDGLVNIDVVKQATAETGYASTYYISQNGVQIGAKINIEKDKMLRAISVETVGSTPTQEEASYNMDTGDKYILMIVNTTDNDGTTRIILPITDVFDLQTADETTITLSAGGVFSIKNGGVDTAQLKDGAVTADKLATAFKNSLLTTSDVKAEITAYCTTLANTINPPSSP